MRRRNGCLITSTLIACALLSACGGGGGGGSGSGPPPPPNNAPVATPADLATPEDLPLNGTLQGQDADHDTLRFGIAQNPAHGSVTLDARTGGFIYTPAHNYFGGDEFTFTVNDGKAYSPAARVAIQVSPVNDAPDIVELSAAACAESRQVIAVHLRAEDPEGSGSHIEVFQPDGAPVDELVMTGDGFSFRAGDFRAATDTAFKVRAVDDDGATSERNLVVTMMPVSASGKLITLAGAPDGPGLHWIITGDGFRAAERSRLIDLSRSAMHALFDHPLFGKHQAAWNVHILAVESAESGADVPSIGEYHDTAFDGTFDCGGIERLTCVDSGKVLVEVLSEHPDYDAVLVLLNSERYGGSGGSLAVVSSHPSANLIMKHEMGHSFAGLADEYIDTQVDPIQDPTRYPEGAFPNVTRETSAANIPWRHWFEDPANIPTVEGQPGIGRFEGAYYVAHGLYRPSSNSFMRSLDGSITSVHAEAWVRGIYQLLSPISGSSPLNPAVTLAVDERRTFGILRSLPLSLQSVRWYLDDQELVAARGFDQVACCTGISGAHTLRVEVSDSTGMIRMPGVTDGSEQRSWSLNLDPDRAAPRITLTSTALSIPAGGDVHLDWSAVNATGCFASGGWSGARAASGSEVVSGVTSSQVYRLECTGAGGQAEELLQVLVEAPGSQPQVSLVALHDAVLPGEPVVLYWTALNATTCTATDGWSGTLATAGRESLATPASVSNYHIVCSGPGGSAEATASVRVRGDAPLVQLSASPEQVFDGTTTMLQWNALHASSCTASGDWSGLRPTEGSEPVGPLTHASQFRLTCTGLDGTGSATANVSIEGAIPADESPVTIVTAGFVEVGGREDHQGLVTGSTAPVVSANPAYLRVMLSDAVGPTVDFSLVDAQGALISSADLAVDAVLSADVHDFVGQVMVPTQPFRIRAQGIDSLSRPFDLTSGLMTPTDFEARLPFGVFQMSTSDVFSAPLVLHNHGAAGDFEVQLTVASGLTLQTPAHYSVHLDADHGVEYTINILPPANPYFGGPVSVSMWRAATPDVVNGSKMRIRVMPILE